MLEGHKRSIKGPLGGSKRAAQPYLNPKAPREVLLYVVLSGSPPFEDEGLYEQILQANPQTWNEKM